MKKKKILGIGISVPVLSFLVWVFFMPLPAPWIDKRANPLATGLVDAFPELKNIGESERASVSWDVVDTDDKAVATFRVFNVSATERQDMILNYLASHIEVEPLSQVHLIFYWRGAGASRLIRNEEISRKPPNQALEPTTPAVTIPAAQEVAPAGVVAHL